MTPAWVSPSDPPHPHPPRSAPPAGLCPGATAGWWRRGGRCPLGPWHTGCPRRRFPTPGRGCGCRGAPGSPGAGRKQPAGPRAGAARSAFTRDLAEPQHLVCSWSRAALPRPGGTAGSSLLRAEPGHWGPPCPRLHPGTQAGTHPAPLSAFGCCSVPTQARCCHEGGSWGAGRAGGCVRVPSAVAPGW